MKPWLALFYTHLMRRWTWWVIVLLAIVVRVTAHFPDWVEQWYSNGIFPWIAWLQRMLLGWIPFSIGDLLYALIFLALLYQVGQLVHGMVKRRFTRQAVAELLQRIFFLMLLVYVGFNLLWGLNYNRPSIASRYHIDVQIPADTDLDTLASDLIARLNHYAAWATPGLRDSFNRKKRLFETAVEAYHSVPDTKLIPAYRVASVKPSLYSYPGNYLGFQGYYNPFTGEAQVNTTIPRVLEPFVTMHEIAHQLGFAREQEANFIAVLATSYSPEPVFRYSMYFDLFMYTMGEISLRDTAKARMYHQKAPRQVQADMEEYRSFLQRHRNPIERGILWVYGEFLRANNQPGGTFTYSEVVPWVIAYRKKYGRNSL